MSYTIWQFKTARFTVRMTAETEYDLDLSWDETGEIAEGIESGLYDVFCAKCAVYLDGHEIGTDYLGNCIYTSFDAFRTESGYFSDMVHEAIREAREHLRNMQPVYIREAA